MTVTEADILNFTLNEQQMAVIIAMAKKAAIGGTSQIRGEEDRRNKLLQDQVVGQIGQYVGSLWLYGSSDPYMQSRWQANQNPTIGDGGSDILGSNIDFKTSAARKTDRPLLNYNLLVRPRELHENWVYILILVSALTKQQAQAHMIGWASDKMLPGEPQRQGVFAGAHALTASQLNPLPPFRWPWNTP